MQRVLTSLILWISFLTISFAQINTDRVLSIGRNALYFEDYVLSIQYFNEVITVKPYLPEPYLYRSIAKIYLDDYLGASQDATDCIDRNPFIVTAYQVRGIARQNLRDYDGAIADYQVGLSMQPENRTFLRNLAIAHAMKKDYAKADSCFDNYIALFPSEAIAYINRAQLKLEQNDSIAALADLNRAIELDKGSAYAYGLRSMLKSSQNQYDEALQDLNKAIRLDPEQAAYYINRGLIKYNNNDIRGAMEDYDQAIVLDPHSVLGLYNRGLMRAQIGDRNRAIDDFTAVLDIEPDNTFASYNRALLRDETGDWAGAIQDYTSVYEQHPNFFPALYARAEDYKKMGNAKASDEDFKQAFLIEQQQKKERDLRQKRREELMRQGVQNPDSVLMAESGSQSADEELTDDERSRKESDRNIRKFNRVMSADIASQEQKYTSDIRGRIQDRQFSVELQPMFILTYYEKSNEVYQGIYFEKTLSDFNRAALLSRRLKVVCHEPMLSQSQVQAHFASVNDYSRLISASGGNAISYFARSLDFMLVQDYQSAIEDLNQVLMRQDRFILAYFNRAVIRFRLLEISEQSFAATSAITTDELKNSALKIKTSSSVGVPQLPGLNGREQNKILSEQYVASRHVECEMAIRDLGKVIELSPTFVYAYYNRAFVASKLNNFEMALSDLNKAIELHPNFAEAYFNRGLILLRTGKTKAGIADLSKAGELGLVQAYSVLKRAQED